MCAYPHHRSRWMPGEKNAFLYQTFSLVSIEILVCMAEASLRLLGDCVFIIGCKCCIVERQISPLLLLDPAILNSMDPWNFKLHRNTEV